MHNFYTNLEQIDNKQQTFKGIICGDNIDAINDLLNEINDGPIKMMIYRKNEDYEDYICDRRLGITSIFISEEFHKINKMIRKSADYIFLGSGLMKRDMKLILSEYNINMSLPEFKDSYQEITKDKFIRFKAW